MHRIPDRKYFQAKSADTRFRAPELEKIYRLMLILSEINRGTLNRYLALRGGTAINLCFTNELPRLSIDIGLVLTRDGDREAMLRDRKFVRRQMFGIFESAGYVTDSYLNHYALDQFDLKYANAFGGRDRVKIVFVLGVEERVENSRIDHHCQERFHTSKGFLLLLPRFFEKGFSKVRICLRGNVPASWTCKSLRPCDRFYITMIIVCLAFCNRKGEPEGFREFLFARLLCESFKSVLIAPWNLIVVLMRRCSA